MNEQRIIEIFYFDAGGGHRSAMAALSEVLADRNKGWIVQPVNLQKILESIDPVYRVTDKLSAIREVLDNIKPKLNPVFHRSLEAIAPKLTFQALQSDQFYNEMLKRGVTTGLDILLPVLQSFIRLASGKIQDILQQHWHEADYKPDLVISVIPNFNSVLYRSLKKVHSGVPYATIMTDMVDLAPHFWMEDQDQFMICGTRAAYRQALLSDFYREEKIHLVSGMILKKHFYDDPKNQDLPLALEGLSSSPTTKTILIMFGGNGSLVSKKIVDQLNASARDVQTIVMCGNHKALYESLKGKKNCCPVPFVANVAPYMRRADLFIGKPGPGSISEAVHMGCPVLVEGTAATMPQERPNIDWILQNGVGATVKDFETDIADAVGQMIANFDIYRQNIEKIEKNNAVFEIAEIADRIMSHAPRASNLNSAENQPSSHVLKKGRYPRWGRLLKKVQLS